MLVGLLTCTQALAAVLRSQVDRNQISINETISLRIIYDAQVNSSELDLRSLAADFEIISNRPQTSSNITITNGQRQSVASTTWDIVLVPKRQGKLSIPAFTLAGVSSKPISVNVTASATSAASDAPLTALISTDSDITYPGQQLLVEIELSASAAVRDLNGEQISLDGAEIEVLDQQSFQRNDNGVVRQIIVLTYALFANEVGTITIPALTFNGVEGGSRSFFDRRSGGKRVIARTKPLELTVKAAEQKPNTAWFTASNVIISSQWSRDKTQAKVGEPLTRTIRIIATGQRASAIPPLKTSRGSGEYKAYTDQPQLEDQKSSKGYTGTRTESEAIVPSISGTITLAEQRLSWWNIKAQRWEEAVLPAETLEVAANPDLASNFNVAPTQIETAQALTQANEQTQKSLDFWKLAVLFLSLVTAIQFIMLFKLNKQPATNKSTGAIKVSDSARWKELQAALKTNDVMTLRKTIISWSDIAVPNKTITSLQMLGKLSGAEKLAPHLQQLDEHLYKGGPEVNLAELSQALDEFKKTLYHKNDTVGGSPHDLAPLYPK